MTGRQQAMLDSLGLPRVRSCGEGFGSSFLDLTHQDIYVCVLFLVSVIRQMPHVGWTVPLSAKVEHCDVGATMH